MYVLALLVLSSPLLARVNASPAVSTITISSAPLATPTSTSYTSDTQFQSDLLTAHNFFRDEHNVSALTWNATCASRALSWVRACEFKHSGGPTGENLAAGYANVTSAVDGWGDERVKYDFKKPTGFSEVTGHFTQVVWSNTTSVGCARKACNGANGTPGYYIVCEYFPPGNVEGDNNQFFKDNVRPQVKGKNTDTVESGVMGTGTTSSSGSPSGNAKGVCGGMDVKLVVGVLGLAVGVALGLV